MCFFCRDEARGDTARLGKSTREELGGVEHIAAVLRLARGTGVADPAFAEAAVTLRAAARLRADVLGEAV